MDRTSGAIEILAGGELARVPLPVARRTVVIHGVARDVGHCLGGASQEAWPADDDCEFAFIVELLDGVGFVQASP